MAYRWVEIKHPFSNAFCCSGCNQLLYHFQTKMFYLVDYKDDLLDINCLQCLNIKINKSNALRLVEKK